MFLFCYNNDFNLTPICICCCILFPVFLDHYGPKYLLLYVVAAFIFSKVIFISKKGDSSLVSSWLKLLCLTSTLAVACCGLGLLITVYHSNEEATYHLFPTIPWLMPVTIPLFLTSLIALGLKPSDTLELTLHIIFIPLVLIFTLLGVYKLATIDDEIVISIKINKIHEITSGIIFFLQLFANRLHRKRCHIGISLTWFLLLLSIIGILSALSEKHQCDGIISCLKILHTWSEPIALALTISTIGLCLPDLFVTVQNYIHQTYCLKKMLTVTKARFNNTIIIGVICAGMVYLCSLFTLIMISGSSLILASTTEKIIDLLNIPKGNDKLFENRELEDSKDNDSCSELSDAESSSSDISLIVAEYKANIRIMDGDTDSAESKIKRMFFIYSSVIAVITILGLLLAYSIQYLQFMTAIITILGLVICLAFQQWITHHVKIFDDPQKSELKAILSYLLGIILLGGIPNQVWFYLAIWCGKGIIIYVIQKNRHIFYKGIQEKHILSIKQSPPAFETTCDSSIQRSYFFSKMQPT